MTRLLMAAVVAGNCSTCRSLSLSLSAIVLGLRLLVIYVFYLYPRRGMKFGGTIFTVCSCDMPQRHDVPCLTGGKTHAAGLKNVSLH